MVLRGIILEMLPSMWPMMVIIGVIVISLRLGYLLKQGKRIVIYKEVMSLIFIIYVLCLYYIVTYKNINYGGVNLVPFKEMFRYSFMSDKFIKNIIGNIVLFIPYGYFSSYFLNNKKFSFNVLLTLIVTLSIELVQYNIGRTFDIDDIILNVIGGVIGFVVYIALDAVKGRLPKFLKSDTFLNILSIVLIVILIIYTFNINVVAWFK